MAGSPVPLPEECRGCNTKYAQQACDEALEGGTQTTHAGRNVFCVHTHEIIPAFNTGHPRVAGKRGFRTYHRGRDNVAHYLAAALTYNRDVRAKARKGAEAGLCAS